MYTDKTIVCKDCGQEFTFTAGEQEFYAERGYNEPQRCKSCRMAKKNNMQQQNEEGAEKTRHPAVCAECGKDCEVPFIPRGDKPVYCSDCFRKIKENKE